MILETKTLKTLTWVKGVYEKRTRVSTCPGKKLSFLNEYMRALAVLCIIWSTTGNNYNNIVMLKKDADEVDRLGTSFLTNRSPE